MWRSGSDHPNIAKVLDGGATETGRPYFVMELVRGIKITDYCDQHQLSTKARIELFIQVCQAVQHAHQKGVIHRDLKPSNILVTQHDDVAVPKIIDFGIAKATTGQLTDSTLLTALRLMRKVNGPEHADTLWAMNNLALSYTATGRWGEALKLREEVLTLRRKVLGPEHPETLATMRKITALTLLVHVPGSPTQTAALPRVENWSIA